MTEVLCEIPESPKAVVQARSTVLLASRTSVAEAGYGARYEAALDPSTRRALDEAVAGVWLPLGIAMAHYRACDTLQLSPTTIAAIGKSTNDRIRGTLYGTFIRAFQEVGVSPWNVLPHWQRFWNRAYIGGAVRVVKVGPKDARVDLVACALCESHYFRHALRGLSNGFFEIFCKRSYPTEIASTATMVSYRYQWV